MKFPSNFENSDPNLVCRLKILLKCYVVRSYLDYLLFIL